MEISKDIEILDLCLYLKKEKILVIPDLHLGFEESLNKQGVMIPRVQLEDTLKRLNKVLKRVKVEKVVIIGDLKHDFGSISSAEWKQTSKLFNFLSEGKREIVLLKGNHDPFLFPIASKNKLSIKDFISIDDVFLCHGDVIFENEEFKKAKRVIIGHEHPAISLREGAKVETFKCFLKGKFKGKELIVMPSFNVLTIGTNILKQRFLSPFLKGSLDNFEVFIVEDKIYYFGKVKNLR